MCIQEQALGTINVNTRLTLVTKKFTLDYNYLIIVTKYYNCYNNTNT